MGLLGLLLFGCCCVVCLFRCLVYDCCYISTLLGGCCSTFGLGFGLRVWFVYCGCGLLVLAWVLMLVVTWLLLVGCCV